jgi:hypothetical protein
VIVSPYRVLRTGKAPPPILAYCQLCDMPAERQCMDIVTSGADWIGVHAQCCGQTSSSRIPWKAFLRLKATGEKWYAITRKGVGPGVRGMARSNFRGMHG